MITIIKLALARYLHKPMSTLLSIILFTIGVAVISLVLRSELYLQDNYKKNLAGIDLVVGAKGSPLQLILSSVLHVDAPNGNIPLEEVNKIKKNPLVKKTIPIALGDNYKGYRIVGTNVDYVDLYKAKLQEGNMFSKPLDAVIGSNVAKKAGIELNSNFVGVHGFIQGGHQHKEFQYTVTGVLKPTGTVMDDLILTPIESVWLVHSHHHHHHEGEEECEEEHHEHHEEAHHEEEHHEHHHASIDEIQHKIDNEEELSAEELQIYNEHHGILTEKEHHPEKEITSLLVFYRNPLAAAKLPRMINENTSLQAAAPAIEFNRLISLLGYGITVLKILAWIIIIISGINIFIYLLNTINQSIHEIALLRTTGISRPKIFMLILVQGSLLSCFGWIAGIILSAVIWQVMPWNNGLEFNIFTAEMVKNDLLLLVYCIVVAILAGLIPAIKIYKTKIHYLLNR